MPTDTRPTGQLPPEPQPVGSIDIFERAFAAAEAAAPLPRAYPASATPQGGLRGLLAGLAGLGGVAFAALGGWMEPRCPNCAARSTVVLELRAAPEGESSRLWERCSACEASWASVRCEDFSGYC
jgi:hypothetical protein